MNPAVGFGRRHPLNPVDATFVFEPRVRPASADLEDDFFETADAGVVSVDDLGRPMMSFGIAGVHPEKVRREEGGLVAAGATPNLDDDVAFVIRVARHEQLAKLGQKRIGTRLELGNLLPSQLVHRLVLVELQQVARVGQLALQLLVRLISFDDLVEVGAFARQLLQALWIGKDVGQRHLLRQLVVALGDSFKSLDHRRSLLSTLFLISRAGIKSAK
jgi:hypothetical protein